MVDLNSQESITYCCKRWTDHLSSKLTTHAERYLYQLFNLAIKKAKDNEDKRTNSLFYFFQMQCLNTADIPYSELQEEVRLIEQDVKNLERTINIVLRLNYGVMSMARLNDLSSIKIPRISAVIIIIFNIFFS